MITQEQADLLATRLDDPDLLVGEVRDLFRALFAWRAVSLWYLKVARANLDWAKEDYDTLSELLS